MRRTILSVLFFFVLASFAYAVPSAPTLSPASGVYPAAEQLSVQLSADEGATIYYTLDGSRPTTSSLRYSEPLTLENGLDDGPNAISRINTGDANDAYDPWYAPASPPRTIPVLRAMAYKDGEASEIVTASYLLGETATRYGATPIFSICAEWMDLFNEDDNLEPKGIYVNKYLLDKRKVPNCHAEMFAQGARRLSSWVELRIQGTSTASRPKKSLRLTGYNGFDGKKRAFDYPFFPGKTNTFYSTIVLRLGGNDWGDSLLRDQLAQAIGKHGIVDVQYGNACIVFLNGVYWGVHEIRERWEDGYFEFQHGGLLGEKGGEYTLLEYGHSDPAVDTGWEDDANTAVNDFMSILSILRSWNNDLSQAWRYSQITNRVNPDSNLQHFGISLFTGNLDWPQNNQRFWRTFGTGIGKGGDPLNDGRWNWTFHDMDFAFTLPFDYVPDYSNRLSSAHDAYTAIHENEGPYAGIFIPDSARIFNAFLSNSDFRSRYLNYVYLHLATAWRPDVTTEVMNEHAARFREAGMDENGLRWRLPQNEADWQSELNAIRDYLLARPKAFSWHTRKRLNYSTNNTLVLNKDGSGQIDIAGFRLHPDTLPGFSGFPAAIPFPADVPVTLTAIPGNGMTFEGWYETTANLPPAPPVPVASDKAANYSQWDNSSRPNHGTGWGNWTVEASGVENAGVFMARSAMPIHGESDNGSSFGLYAHTADFITVRRSLAEGRTLDIGQTLSVDVGFGIAGGNGGAGLAFLGADGAQRPVELILTDEAPAGTAYRLYLNGTAYLLDNFPHIVGAPIKVALSRTSQTGYTLRLLRAGYTYATTFTLPETSITGLRFFKNPYGDSADGYNFYFNNLRLAQDTFASEAPLPRHAADTIVFFEDANQFYNWTLWTEGAGGSWQNGQRLSNVGRPSFGLWANNGGSVKQQRAFGFTLNTNTTLSFDFQNNALKNEGGATGVNLLTSSGESFTLLAAKGAANYQLYTGGQAMDTGVSVISTGIHVEVTPLSAGRLRVLINATELNVDAESAIQGIEFFNSNVGEGAECDVFFNNILICSPNGTQPPPAPELERQTVFSETGLNQANWTFQTGENAGTWVAASSGIGENAFGLWANSGEQSAAVRSFGFVLAKDHMVSFQFQHGQLSDEFSSVGWELLDASGSSVCGMLAGRGDAHYWLFTPQDLVETTVGSTTSPQTFSITFLDDQQVSIAGQELTLPARATGIRFWNATAGSGGSSDMFFNHVTVTAPNSQTAQQALSRAVETLLSTNAVFSITPSANRSILARFAPAALPSAYQQWAQENDIEDLYGYHPETGLSYAEEFLREIHQVQTLHSGGENNQYFVVPTAAYGIQNEIQVNTNLLNGTTWRQPTQEELLAVPGATNTYQVMPPNGGLLAIRLRLLPMD
ncbi:MAG: CotH kinase family protein [Verrucomicrobiota bacterium]|jgi:hypothetical protein|nr:CotH kinase family protein [Verrucomicrobiota bacterium]